MMTTRVLDTSGMQCPMPLLKTKLQLNAMAPGDLLEVISTDPGSARDIPAFLNLSSHSLERVDERERDFRFLIRCGRA
jgi:TusA-related sulfurtransferase